MLSVLPLIFYKDSTIRRQYKQNLFVFIVEMQFGKQVKKSFEKQIKKSMFR